MWKKRLPNELIDWINWELIVRYQWRIREFEAEGAWTGVLGIRVDTPPPKPELLKYSTEMDVPEGYYFSEN